MRHGAWALKSTLAQPGVRAAFRRMLEAEHAPREVLERRSRAATMALARYAWETTDFYRERFEAAGLSRSDLDEDLALESLPILDKADVRAAGSKMFARGRSARDRLPSSTGGSTGQPLVVRHDRRSPVAAMWWRIYGWWGIRPGDDVAFVQRDRRSASRRRREAVEWWPTRHSVLDATAMTDERIAAFLDDLAHRTTPLLNGYVGGVHELALEAERTGRGIPGLRAIGVTAAPLTPSQRAVIERALGATVHDQYRSAEVPWIAAECHARSGLHVAADLRRLELVDGTGRPGAEGEIVVTDLTNRVFPLIRYRLGDRSGWLQGDCVCGRTLPRIRAVEGRVTDVLRLPDGQRISGGLTGLFNARPDAVSQFQVAQAADGSVRLRWVRGSADDATEVAADAVRLLRRIARDQVAVTAVEVDRIDHVAGKFRVVVSEVPDG